MRRTKKLKAYQTEVFKAKKRYSIYTMYTSSNMRLELRPYQGSIVLSEYKGTILIKTQGESEDQRHAWLHGEDIDLLIKLLKRSKKAWVKGRAIVRQHLRDEKRKKTR